MTHILKFLNNNLFWIIPATVFVILIGYCFTPKQRKLRCFHGYTCDVTFLGFGIHNGYSFWGVYPISVECTVEFNGQANTYMKSHRIGFTEEFYSEYTCHEGDDISYRWCDAIMMPSYEPESSESDYEFSVESSNNMVKQLWLYRGEEKTQTVINGNGYLEYELGVNSKKIYTVRFKDGKRSRQTSRPSI